MHIRKPQLSRHRRQRLLLWTLALLTWAGALLGGQGRIDARHVRRRLPLISLDLLTWRTIRFLIVRAGELARMRRRTRVIVFRRGRDLTPRHLIRSLLGARLRRAFKHKDAASRIAALIRVLRNLDAYAGPLARRLKRRLTRLWPIAAKAAPTEAILASPAPEALPALANTS